MQHKNSCFFKLFFLLTLLCSKIVFSQTQASKEARDYFFLYGDSIREVNRLENTDLYLKYYFKQLEYINQLDEYPNIILEFHAQRGYDFSYWGYYRQSNYHLLKYLEKYDKFKSFLSPDYKAQQLPILTNSRDHLAQNFSSLGKPDSSKFYLYQNIKLVESLDTVVLQKPDAYNNLGLYYLNEKKEIDSSLFFFEKALEITTKYFPESFVMGSVINNIAEIKNIQGKTDEAKTLYFQNYQFYRTNKTYHTKIKIDIFNLVAAAKKYLKLAEQTNDSLNVIEIEDVLHFYDINYPEYQKELLQLKLDFLYSYLYIAQIRKKTEKIISLLQKIAGVKNEQIIEIQNRLLTNASISTLNGRQAQNNFQMNIAQKEVLLRNQQLITGFLGVTALLLMGSIFYLYDRKKRRRKLADQELQLFQKQAELNALKAERLEVRVKNKERDLSDFAMHLTQNHEWVKKLFYIIEKVKISRGRGRQNQLKNLEDLINSKVQYDNDTSYFYERLDQLNAGFYETLKNKFPKLTKNEKQLCSLIRLKIDSKEIVTLQNITPASLNKSRYRLRQHLRLNREDDLDNFIQSL